MRLDRCWAELQVNFGMNRSDTGKTTGGAHVLLVDDEPAFRSLVRRLLARGGFSIAEASSGEEALRLVDAGLVIDAVLLDYRMPGLNGAETFKELRRRGLRVPVVLVSAATDVEELAARYGFDGALKKPCSAEEIQRLLGALLAKDSAERSRLCDSSQ